MSWNLLLNWMTHVGEGSWSLFRKTVGEIAPDGADVQKLCRILRIALSDLRHADFFIDGSQRWRTFPPILGGLAVQTNVSVLYGGRTPRMLEELQSATENRDCQLVVSDYTDRPACISIEGSGEVIAAIADECGLVYVPNIAEALTKTLIPLPVKMLKALDDEAPINWVARSFDLKSQKWVEGLLRNSACEFTSRYGARRFFLHYRGRKLREMSKRDAVYASSMIQCIRIAEYSPIDSTLSTPLFAPMPEMYSRIACICSGTLPNVSDRRLVYKEVPENVASLLLVAVGQPHPKDFSVN